MCRDTVPPSSTEGHAGELGLEHGEGRVPGEMQGVGSSAVFEAGEGR